eukprot:6185411-Pleurochrysis_carterae.AAC.3
MSAQGGRNATSIEAFACALQHHYFSICWLLGGFELLSGADHGASCERHFRSSRLVPAGGWWGGAGLSCMCIRQKSKWPELSVPALLPRLAGLGALRHASTVWMRDTGGIHRCAPSSCKLATGLSQGSRKAGRDCSATA